VNEMRRSVYLQAMGIDAYVSRSQVPGAAETRRLAIVRAAPSPMLRPEAASPMAMPHIETGRAVPVRTIVAAQPAPGNLPPRFSLAAITCGGWLWLEELEGASVAPEQLQLVQAMAEALGTAASRGDGDSARGGPSRATATQFDWPIHSNQQLDQGEDAARASLAAFIRRKLEQPGCNGLVLLGSRCEARVPLAQLDCARLARTAGTAEMLRNPLVKKQAWRDLMSLLRSP